MEIGQEIVRTKHLEVMVYKEKSEWKWIKVAVYSIDDSPYGWTKRNLIHSPFGLKVKHVKSFAGITEYIQTAIHKVYRSGFPQEEVEELLNKIKEKI
jgi:hypothetical protein|tara:strand:- start:1168 stop:1458 length:291 start_codon:yes stop_codon:yes gene_type:complete